MPNEYRLVQETNNGKYSENSLNNSLKSAAKLYLKSAKVRLRLAGKLLRVSNKTLKIISQHSDKIGYLGIGVNMAANAVNSALEDTEYGEKIAPYVDVVAAGAEFVATNQDIIQDGVNKFVNVSKYATAVLDTGLKIVNSVYGFDKPNNKDQYANVNHNSNVKNQEVYKSIVSILRIPEQLRERNIFATSEVLDSAQVKNKEGNYPNEINFIKQQITGIDPTDLENVNNVLRNIKQGIRQFTGNSDGIVKDVIHAFAKSLNFKQVVSELSKNPDLKNVISNAFKAFDYTTPTPK